MCEYAYPVTGDAHAFSRQIPRCMMPSPATTITTASATRIGVHQLAPVLIRRPAGPPTASLLARTSGSSRVGATGSPTCTGTGYLQVTRQGSDGFLDRSAWWVDPSAWWVDPWAWWVDPSEAVWSASPWAVRLTLLAALASWAVRNPERSCPTGRRDRIVRSPCRPALPSCTRSRSAWDSHHRHGGWDPRSPPGRDPCRSCSCYSRPGPTCAPCADCRTDP